MVTDAITVPSACPRNAWTTALLTASETARRMSLRQGSGTPCSYAKSTTAWRSWPTLSADAGAVHEADGIALFCPRAYGSNPRTPRTPGPPVGRLSPVAASDDRDLAVQDADARDRSAESRDRAAGQRDVRAAIRDALEPDQSETARAGRKPAGDDRTASAEDRSTSGTDRRAAAGDRQRRRDERREPAD